MSTQSKLLYRRVRLVVVLLVLAVGGGSEGAIAATKHRGRPGRVQTGLDVLEAQKFAILRNKHVGLITNHTGLDSEGRSVAEQNSFRGSVGGYQTYETSLTSLTSLTS